MKNLLFLLLAITTVHGAISQQVTVNKLTDMPSDMAATVFNQIRVFPVNTQLSIACIENGKAAFFGVIRRNDTLVSITNRDSVFEIGSVTKVFTNTLLANYVVKGAIRLEDTVNDLFDFPFKEDKSISFLSLANHSSGLPRLPSNLPAFAPNPYLDYDTTKLNAYLKNDLALSEKREYAYSNLGTGLLGYALFRFSGQTPQDMVKKEIFTILGMHHSFTSRHDVKKGMVKGLNPSGQPALNWDFDILFSAGGILSSASDLSRFLAAHFDPAQKALALTRQPTLTVNENLKLGLGWHIVKTAQGEAWWHNGGTAGYTSSVAFDPVKKSGIIILSNVSAFHPQSGNVDNLCFELLENIE